MPIAELWISVDHLQGAIAAFLILAATSVIDYIVNALFDRKVFDPVWKWIRRKFKAWRTKRDKITSNYEFSIYLDSYLSQDVTRDVVSAWLEAVNQRSDGDFEVEEKKWSSDQLEVDIEVLYENRLEPFEMTLNFVPDSMPRMGDHSVQNGEGEPKIGSVGVNIRFRFAFGELKASIIDLMLFARFLRDAAEDLFSIREFTDCRFVVSLVASDLALDDWVQQERFDVSLLLDSEDGRRSVEFYSDRAVISSPHTEVDGNTVEYIRAALLNYYL